MTYLTPTENIVKNNSSWTDKKKYRKTSINKYTTAFLVSVLSDNASAITSKELAQHSFSSVNRNILATKDQTSLSSEKSKKSLNSLYSGERIYDAPK
jgi:hypothetical protein